MPRRSSTGELVPKDISEILAREARAHRGQRKPGGPLGQAFGWLKGSRKKKNSVGNGVNGTGTTGTADAKADCQNHAPGKAGPRKNEEQKGLSVHYRASQHYPENVFIEGNRSRYLEDLHTEAQEGLKILQQEEHHIDGSFADDQSVSSTNTLRPEQDVYSLDSGCSPEPGITAGNSATTLTSSAPATSTRPVLTRQASTFKPLNSTETVKIPDKSKKKSRRTTIMGIPQQVQRELALQRSSTFQPITSSQLTNGDGQVNDGLSGVLVIPTINGETPVANQEGARVNLSDLEVSREDQLLRKHLQAVYQEEQLSNPQDFGYHLMTTISQRPKSLAGPGMTTSSSPFSFLHEPQGPVMSISPQATYLSKIIPNAVLPASTEVIQINRSGSRTFGGIGIHGGSVRAVSKSSLMSADSSVSPISSRRSDGDGSNADDSQKSTTALEFNCSQSSEMTTMNTSTVSTKQSTDVSPQTMVRLAVQGSPSAEPNGSQDHVSVCSSMSWVSSPSDNTGSPGKSQGSDCEASGSVSGGEEMRSSHSFTRNLSVVKTKLPPAPPQRTNSLHSNKMRKNSKDLLVVKDLTDSVSGAVNASTENVPSQTEVQFVISETTREEPQSISVAVPSSSNELKSSASSSSLNPFPDSNSGTGEPSKPPSVSSSSLQKTRSEGSNSERTMSPSSGYSSRSGTPTLSPKGISPKAISPTSPDKQKKRPVKPERSGSRASSSPASPSSSLTSLSSTASDPTHQEVPVNIPGPTQQESPPSTENFTQVCFSPSFADREMFNIPPPPKVRAPCAPPPEVWAHNTHSVELLCGPPSYSSRPVSMKTRSSQTTDTHTEANQEDAIQVSESKRAVSQEKTLLEEILETVTQVLDSREGSHLTPEKVDLNTDVQWEEQSSSLSIKDTERPEKILKKQPPPVMKKTIPGTIRDELFSRRKLEEEHLQQQADYNDVRDDCVTRHNPTSSLQPDIQVSQSEDETVTPMQTLAVEPPDATKKVDKGSPPPSPPPAYHPTPPPSRKTPPSPISDPSSVVLEGVQEEAHAVETCWPPPPPPPLEGDMNFEGGEEVDFPPPPPFVMDILPDVINGCMTATKGPDQPGAALEEAKLTMEDSCSTEEQNDEKEMSINMLAEEERRPIEGITQYPDINCTGLETRYKLLQDVSSLPEVVPPPPREATPPLPPITTSEIPLSNPAPVPLSSVSQALLTQAKCPAPTEAHISAPFSPPVIIPQAPSPPSDHKCPGVNFRRQPSLANRDTRSKEILSRHKSVPIPKEDANIPLVTPSLLQMVRLRAVSMVEDEISATPTEDQHKPSNGGLQSAQDNCPVPTSGPQSTPQKPIRKSLSYKSAHTVKTPSVTLNSPSMRLQEAIRMKTAAMSSRDCLPSRLGSRLSMSSGFGESGTLDPLKSCASTASFIFSKSTKKVVIETASSPEAQAGLKQSLAAELIQVTDRTKDTTVSNGEVKWDKVPPPVAKKPALGSTAPSNNRESGKEVNTGGGVVTAPPAGYGTSSRETTTTTVTPDTIETLF